MQIRTRLTLLFTAITAGILLAYASVIYYSAKETREQEFYVVLKREAITKANLFLSAKTDATTLQNIYRSNRQILNEVEVAIYDKDFNLLYHDAVDIDFVKETPDMINEIFNKGEIQFYQQNWQVIGLRFEYEEKIYIITAAAYDQYGYSKLTGLLRDSIVVFIIAILFIYIAGRFFSKKAFEPVKEMTEKARKISATNLDLRLSSNGNTDELAQLANTFNEMLSRLENSFDAQKHFVSNISHELRTPLAAIIAELELATTGERTAHEYKSAFQNALGDAKKLARLSNSLLDLAKASYDPSEISFKQIRIDEILLDARQQVQLANPHYKIDIHFSESGNEDEITLPGNEYLLKTAFANLFENGCKFSTDKQSNVSVYFKNNSIVLKFSDKGVGISSHDLEKIFTPFYRGENKTVAEGNGIGLYLTQKIIQLHKGKIVVESERGSGTIFAVEMHHN
ncbi:MAG: HAMP domain-containing histidine kinase [Cyclobacteriaceae bacterium]|nr:HAMP domain-containing histidine kinase [Cyclobacteriaceae bacterium]UYN88219.1 MAG: HAMP domain-containing histidine kinase [Cyclobacteriaceae bacterium]